MRIITKEQLEALRCSCDAVKITLFNALDWQAVAYFRREDPDLRALAEALLACCTVGGRP